MREQQEAAYDKLAEKGQALADAATNLEQVNTNQQAQTRQAEEQAKANQRANEQAKLNEANEAANAQTQQAQTRQAAHLLESFLQGPCISWGSSETQQSLRLRLLLRPVRPRP